MTTNSMQCVQQFRIHAVLGFLSSSTRIPLPLCRLAIEHIRLIPDQVEMQDQYSMSSVSAI